MKSQNFIQAITNRTTLFPTKSIPSLKSTKLTSQLISTSTTIFRSSHSNKYPILFVNAPQSTTSLFKHTQINKTTKRNYSTSNKQVVDLSFSVIAPSNAPDAETNGLKNTLVIHGLFGSGNNWRGMSKRMSDTTQSNIYLMDMRNHGTSPHSDDITYEIMAEDVKAFIEQRSLKNVSLIGHSMGGKISMVLALKYPELVKKLLIVDIAPHSLANAFSTFDSYCSAMLTLDFDKITSRKKADEALQAAVPDIGVRQFLLTNLTVGGDKLSWKCNLQGLHNNIDKLMDFPQINKTYNNPTLFVAGRNSNYVADKHMPTINKLFPSNKVVHIDGAGHWVHAEKPNEFLEQATNFLK